MSLNSTAFSHPPYFLLTGIPGLKEEQFWIAFPFCIMYGIALLGNITLLPGHQGRAQPARAHAPLLAVLAFTDLVLPTSTTPKMLSIFWLGSGEIGFPFCLTQMFFIHTFSAVELGVLTAMALDHLVAICCTLRHSSLLLVPVVVALVSLVLLRGVFLVNPMCFLLHQRHFCQRDVITHCYCEHTAVVKLACGDTRASVIYGLLVAFLVAGSNLALISVSHLCVMLAFYTPLLFTCLAHRFGQGVSAPTHVMLANLYLLVPPALNSIVYGVSTKKMWDRVAILFQHKGA